MASIHIFRDGSKRQGILDSPDKCFHSGQSDFHNFTGDESVGFPMHALRSFGVWSIDKAKGRTTPFIKPVGQKLDAVPILDVEILKMCRGDIRSGNAGKLVPVHEDRHWFPPKSISLPPLPAIL